MVAVNSDMQWRNSAAGLGGALGAAFHDLQGTLSATGSLGDTFLTDTTLGGSDGDHDNKWITMVDGNAELFVAQVKRSLAGVGFQIDERLPSSVGIGDTYRVFPNTVGTLDCDASESAVGTPTHRGWYVENNAGEVVDENFVWIKPIRQVEHFDLEVFVDDANGTTGAFPTIADPVVGPTQSQLDTLDTDNEFSSPKTTTMGQFNQPRRGNAQADATLNSSGGTRALYVKRTVIPNTPPVDGLFLVVFEARDLSLNLVRVGLPVFVSAVGFTPQVTTAYDRIVRIGGGTRVDVVLKAQETSAVVPKTEVAFKLAVGPGSLSLADDGAVTDDDGKAFVSYVAPTIQSDAGMTITVESRV